MIHVNLMMIESGVEARNLHFTASSENLKNILEMAATKKMTPGALIEEMFSTLFDDFNEMKKLANAYEIKNGDLVMPEEATA